VAWPNAAMSITKQQRISRINRAIAGIRACNIREPKSF
jgi:hypothetical protein